MVIISTTGYIQYSGPEAVNDVLLKLFFPVRTGASNNITGAHAIQVRSSSLEAHELVRRERTNWCYLWPWAGIRGAEAVLALTSDCVASGVDR